MTDRTEYNRAQKRARRAEARGEPENVVLELRAEQVAARGQAVQVGRRFGPVLADMLVAVADMLVVEIADKVAVRVRDSLVENPRSEVADKGGPSPVPLKGTGGREGPLAVRADNARNNGADADTGPVRESVLAPDDERERVHQANAEFLERFRNGNRG